MSSGSWLYPWSTSYDDEQANRPWRAVSRQATGIVAEPVMLEIYVDADGCPVKDEVYRVAGRYGVTVWVVANAWLRVPDDPRVRRVTVTEGLDRADDWIAERIGLGDRPQDEKGYEVT
jgi:hypothetical protein